MSHSIESVIRFWVVKEEKRLREERRASGLRNPEDAHAAIPQRQDEAKALMKATKGS